MEWPARRFYLTHAGGSLTALREVSVVDGIYLAQLTLYHTM
jgi:hypothetical protein